MLDVVLLTTETTHHAYFTRKISQIFPLRAVVVETRALQPPFETMHPFERVRDQYEREVLLEGHPTRVSDFAETIEVESVNASIQELQRLRPDVVLVFGTGRLLPAIFGIPLAACLNLHGGNPEQYRGLDSHLWTIYHDDFANLLTTLHLVDDNLDTGNIVFQSQIPLTPATQIHELRSVNTDCCFALSRLALESLNASGSVPSRPQLQRGRYYSFMPAVLKDRCVRNFERFVAGLA